MYTILKSRGKCVCNAARTIPAASQVFQRDTGSIPQTGECKVNTGPAPGNDVGDSLA
jgi:hypothetical protein